MHVISNQLCLHWFTSLVTQSLHRLMLTHNPRKLQVTIYQTRSSWSMDQLGKDLLSKFALTVMEFCDMWGGGWGLVTSWEWRCSWSSADRWCSSYIWVINNLSILLPNKVHLISEVCHKNSVGAKRQNYRERSDFQLILISSPSNAAYMHQWIGSALVKIMACRLFGAKPLSKPMLGYCQLDHWEQTSVKFWSKYKTFHSWKSIWKYHLRNGGHVVQGEMC